MRQAVLFPLVAIAMAVTSASAQQAPVLVSTAWLSDHLRDPGLVILHVGNEASYTTSHIPGARLMVLAAFGPEREGLSTEMPDPAAFKDLLETAGVSNASRIVVYSATNPPTIAARLYVTLEHFGLGTQTSLLDGGLRLWTSEARAVSTDAAPATRGTVTLRQQTNVLADYSYVNALVGQPTGVIIDARDAPFWTGASQNQTRAARAGRIPGAANLTYSTVIGESGRFLEGAALTALFTAAGVPAGKPVVTYCHVGQQASLLFVAARLAGHDVRLYDGSYEDWSKRPELKVEIGNPLNR